MVQQLHIKLRLRGKQDGMVDRIWGGCELINPINTNC